MSHISVQHLLFFRLKFCKLTMGMGLGDETKA